MKTIFTVLMVLVMTVSAHALTVVLEWDAPTTNADGTPLTDLAGFRAYLKQADGTYQQMGSDIPKDQLITDITELQSGYHCFTVTAFDASNNESEYADELCRDSLPPAKFEFRIRIE